jgi:arylsulfatase A
MLFSKTRAKGWSTGFGKENEMKFLQKLGKYLSDGRTAAVGLIAGSTALNALPGTPQAQATEPQPPNILFIIMDDLGWTDINCNKGQDAQGQPITYQNNAGGTYDSTYYYTPNIAKLRQDSIRFTNAYAACPFCKPARAAIMTGKYPHRLHMTTLTNSAPLPLAETTIAEALKAGGNYATGIFGKTHFDGGYNYTIDPTNQGFDAFDPGSGWPLSVLDGDCTEKAIEYMHDAASEGRPFFTYLAYWMPHAPVEDGPFAQPSPNDIHQNKAYAAYLKHMDEHVGAILTEFDDGHSLSSIRDKTIIIFTSDNGGRFRLRSDDQGGACGYVTRNDPLRDEKFYSTEGGLRVPLMIKWPGVTDGSNGQKVCDVPVCQIDFFPTILQMAFGANYDPDAHYSIDGKSIVQLFRNQTANIQRSDPALFFTAEFDADAETKTFRPALRMIDGINTGYRLIKDEGLDVYFTFDANENLKDMAGRLHPGTANGGPTYPTGKLGNALALTGSNYVTIGNYKGVVFDRPRTVSCWIHSPNPNTGTIGGTIVSWGSTATGKQKWNLSVNGRNNKLELNTGVSFLTSTDVIGDTTTTWKHIAVVYKDTSVILYIDGENKSPTGNDNFNVNTDPSQDVIIGASNFKGVNHEDYFTGSIDDFRIYNRALAEEEIWLLAHPPVGHWKLDESSVTTAARNWGCVPNPPSGTLSHNGLEGYVPIWRPLVGMLGGALEFDGTDDYVAIGRVGNITAVSFWVRLRSLSDTNYPVTLTSSQYIKIYKVNPQDTYSTVSAVGFTSPTIYIDGDAGTQITNTKWHHITITTSSAITANAVEIGRCNGQGYFTGMIDDVRLYDSLDSNKIHFLANLCDYQVYNLNAEGGISESSDLCLTSGVIDDRTWDLKKTLDTWLDGQQPYRDIDVGGNTYTKVYPTIQDAIYDSPAGSIIILPPASFHESITINKNITLKSKNPDDPRIVAATIIDGKPDAGNHRVVTFIGSGITASCRVEGMTITGGKYNNHGAGIYGGISGSFATIHRCTIRDNVTTGIGCGAGIFGLYGEISECIITNNRSSAHGGGLASIATTSKILNCLITGNSAGWNGGAINNGCGSFINCTITNNYAVGTGGGFRWVDSSKPEAISNCIVWGNTDGDPQTNPRDEQIFENGTTRNVTYSWIQGQNGDNPQFVNAPVFTDGVSQLAVNNSRIYVLDANGTSTPYEVSNETNARYIEIGNDNIARKITVVDTTYNYLEFTPGLNAPATAGTIIHYWGSKSNVIEDYHLQSGSPCINAGAEGSYGVQKDIDGQPRVVGTRVDMGADEYKP